MVQTKIINDKKNQARSELVKSTRPFKKRNSNGKKLSEMVFDYVIQNITNGQYMPSEKISPTDIAKALDLSPMPVRNAMERLEDHGWIERLLQNGTYVKSFDPEEITEIFEIREMIEVESVRILCCRDVQKELSWLREILEKVEIAANENNAEKYRASDMEFHRRLVQCVGNKRLGKVFESILLQSLCFFNQLSAAVAKEAKMEYNSTNHRCVYEAIKSQKPQEAERVLRKHIGIAAEWNKAVAKVRALETM